jgi:uncharacterized cupin superfamily protein
VVPEARLERAEHGLKPVTEGWFIANVHNTRWFDSSGCDRFTVLDSEEARFTQVGIGIGVVRPGEPSAMYHGEDAQEAFLVLSGECMLIVEAEQRQLKAWDFVHCPPWTEHVFVGAGNGPFVVLGVGARRKGRVLLYPVNETALKHGAGVEEETKDPAVAYARFPEAVAIPCPEDFPG